MNSLKVKLCPKAQLLPLPDEFVNKFEYFEKYLLIGLFELVNDFITFSSESIKKHLHEVLFGFMKGLILESSFISKSNSHALEAIVLPA